MRFDEEAEVELLEELELELQQVESIDAACKFKSFIIIVKIILVLGGQQEGREHELMDVAVTQREGRLAQVVAVHVDYRQQQAFAREAWVFGRSAGEGREGQGGDGVGVEGGGAGGFVLVEQVQKQP